MIALLNFNPTTCPNCGTEFTVRDPHLRRCSEQDWLAGAASTCKRCGLHLAYVDGRKLLELASATGDMGRYVTDPD
jgi:predicted RNA-binding Zn-ribbon protein involved in translation (DUF1610 family)